MDRFLRRHFDRARENTHRGPDGRLYQTRGGSGRRTYPDDEGWGRSEWHPPSSYHGEGSGRMPSSSHRRRPSPSPAYGRSSFSGSRGGGEEPGSFWNTPEGERYIEEHWGSLDEFDGGHTSRGRSRSHRAPSPEMYDEPHFDYRGPGMSHSQSHRTPRYDYGEPGISRRSSHRSSFDHHEGGGYGPRIEIRTPGGGSRYGGGHSRPRYSPPSSPYPFEGGRGSRRAPSYDRGGYGSSSPYMEERWPGMAASPRGRRPASSRSACGSCRRPVQGLQCDDCPNGCGRFHYACLLDTAGGMRCPSCHVEIPDCG